MTSCSANFAFERWTVFSYDSAFLRAFLNSVDTFSSLEEDAFCSVLASDAFASFLLSDPEDHAVKAIADNPMIASVVTFFIKNPHFYFFLCSNFTKCGKRLQ